MRDPLEGLTADGVIRTGADRERIPERFAGLLGLAVDRIRAGAPDASVYVYGSVATGMARSPDSDVDVLTFGLPPDRGVAIGAQLSRESTDLCRGVEIATATVTDLDRNDDEGYGGRVFLHHYCVHLAGPDLDRATTGFRGDRRSARGFNGDIANHAAHWGRDLDGADAAQLGRRAARKSLLAVAGLVSVHDQTWTTDREHATRRWQQVHPDLADGLGVLLDWSAGRAAATPGELVEHMDTTVDRIVHQFAADVGLW